MNIREILNSELNILKNDIVSRHKAAGQVASGRTAASFEVKLTENGGQLLSANYAGVLERGRKPGKVPFDFKNILLKWAAAKGISFQSDADANRWAYFVAQKIKREGTTLYRSGRTEDIFETAIADFSDRLTERIGAFVSIQIKNEIFNF